MGLPETSETNELIEVKKANGSGGRGKVIGFFTESRVAGRYVVPHKLFALMDCFAIMESLMDSILALSSSWRLISKNTEPPFYCWREVLSQTLISGVVNNSTRKDWLCEEEPGRDLYLALGIHLLFLIYYLHRSTVSFNLLDAFYPDVSISLRVKYIKSWIFHSTHFIIIYWLTLFVSQDNPKWDTMRIFTAALRLSFCMTGMHEISSYWERIQRKEKEYP